MQFIEKCTAGYILTDKAVYYQRFREGGAKLYVYDLASKETRAADLSLPIQQFEGFEYCPYLLTAGGFLALKLGMKLLFYLFITALSALAAVLVKRAAAAVLPVMRGEVYSIGVFVRSK